MNGKLKVLMTGYEIAPFYKRGGLGDVMESLPKALTKIDIDVRVVVPYYQAIKSEIEEERIGQFFINFGSGEEEVGIYKKYFPNTKIIAYFLSNKLNLSYVNTRGRNKKIDQFAFFDLAVSHFVLWLSKNASWEPQIIHCNDWQTALIPLILKKKTSLNLLTLLTIHNLNYQGKGSLKVLELLHMKDEDTKEIKRGTPVTEINILGEGIIHATRVSTVSPSYAKEIVGSYSHDPIHYFLTRREKEQGRKDEVLGILNGIDYEVWSPEVDQFIYHKFNVQNMEEGKKNNKEDLLKSLGLQNRPTFCFIGRMANQKGLDVLIKAVRRISHLDINLIILGSGDLRIQASVLKITEKFPWVKPELVYNEELAHKIYAGSDFIIIPSRYEPCGLIQMIAMKYGTIPIASKTGGLQDSITNGKNGLLFKKGRSVSLQKAIKHALDIQKDRTRYRKMVVSAMRKDFSWDKSAQLYKKLYQGMVNSK